MDLRDPIVVYTGASNLEVQLVKVFLSEAGIDACADEDLSLAGLWAFGTLPGIHQPRVWVSTQDRERAQRLLVAYENLAVERQQASQNHDHPAKTLIDVQCEECKVVSSYPSAQLGTVQECPRCGAYVDVGDIDAGESYWLEDGESGET
ncbi:MAG TPA: DUF2007 domain-containing protein [Pirellulales bacterium]|nr:DUF2007 domain-containing protein [Pirellulales bacterium]